MTHNSGENEKRGIPLKVFPFSRKIFQWKELFHLVSHRQKPIFHSNCKWKALQSSRSLPQVRRIVGSGDENTVRSSNGANGLISGTSLRHQQFPSVYLANGKRPLSQSVCYHQQTKLRPISVQKESVCVTFLSKSK